jgi:glyoxylase-like metal-dependent hydrolase (beta-lactamase superfamily II)
MRQIVRDVYLVEGVGGAHVYLLTSGDDLALVDTGMRGAADRITTQIQEAGFLPSGLRTIVLTHAHSDHTGGAGGLARRFGARILAYRAEVPYLEGMESLPACSLLPRFLLWLSDRLVFGQTTCAIDRAVEDGETIDALGGLAVIHTPGHTPGSMCLYHPERKLLFCGDTLFNVHPLTGRKGLRLAVPFFSTDVAQVRTSVSRLAALPVDVLCPGHGDPILDGTAEQIRSLLDRGEYDTSRA